MIGSKVIVKPITVELIVNHKSLVKEIDTGAAISLVSEATFRRVFPDEELHHSRV